MEKVKPVELKLQEFLGKIASETEDIIRNDAHKAQFLNFIKAYREMREKFLQVLQQCKNEAIKNQWFYDENDTEPPIGREKWEQGWKLEKDYLIKIPGKPKPIYRAFWRPPLPFDPDAWIMRHYGSPQYNDIVAIPSVPKEPKDPDKAENLICEYIVLAVINDNVRTKPQCQKLFSSSDNEWSENLWGSIYWCKSINDGNAYKYRIANIKNALKNVKAKLAKRPEDTEQDATSDKKNGKFDCLYKLYEKTLKALFSAVIEAMKS